MRISATNITNKKTPRNIREVFLLFVSLVDVIAIRTYPHNVCTSCTVLYLQTSSSLNHSQTSRSASAASEEA